MRAILWGWVVWTAFLVWARSYVCASVLPEHGIGANTFPVRTTAFGAHATARCRAGFGCGCAISVWLTGAGEPGVTFERAPEEASAVFQTAGALANLGQGDDTGSFADSDSGEDRANITEDISAGEAEEATAHDTMVVDPNRCSAEIGAAFSRQLVPDAAALDKSCREILHSEKKDDPDKAPGQNDGARGNGILLDLYPSLRPEPLHGYDLLLAYYRGVALFSLYAGQSLSEDLLDPAKAGLFKDAPAVGVPPARVVHNSFLRPVYAGTDPASFWLFGTDGYRRVVSAEHGSVRPGFEWKGYQKLGDLLPYWKVKAMAAVPEPSVLALIVLGSVPLARRRLREPQASRIKGGLSHGL